MAELVLVGVIAAFGESIDSALGMMYGTLLSPILILFGYDPLIVIPSILVSQAVGGTVGSIRHHAHGNASFNGLTRDMKIALAIAVPGIAACAAGAYVGNLLPKMYITLYIGVIVLLMGVICIRPVYYRFTWAKMWGIGLVSGFNKALSGGGFGPITSTGKILGGVDPKVSVGTTTLAEVPICLASFALWLVFGGSIGWQFPVAMCAGAIVGGAVGPFITSRIRTSALRVVVGVVAVASGVWLLIALLV